MEKFGNFENRPFVEASREPESYPMLEAALRRSEKVFAEAIDPMTFARSNGGPYEEESIRRDMEYVDKMERTFIEQNLESAHPGARARFELMQKLGKVFESIVLFNGDNNNWFGRGAQMIVPARYDDIVHGVDALVELESSQKGFFSNLALGVDATVSANLDRKLRRILDEIGNGSLTKVRYFHSDRQRFTGQKNDIPRVVVGADHRTIHDLMQPWAEMKNRDLADHPVQIQILDEMVWQLDAFAKYALKKKKPDLAEICQNDALILRGVLKEKEEEFGPQKIAQMRLVARKDSVYQKIRQATESGFSDILSGRDG
jgi:hypothetical protein